MWLAPANVAIAAVWDRFEALLVGLIADEISIGRLLRPWSQAVEPKESYYLLYQQSSLQRSPVARVREWLLSIDPAGSES